MKKRKIDLPSTEEEKRINKAIKGDKDAAEWTDEMFAQARPAKEALPAKFFEEMKELKRKRGRPATGNLKQHIGVRLDPDIVKWLRSHKGYNALINDALRRVMDADRSR